MHNFKKQFGQNFLKNSKYAVSLVNNLELVPEDTVIEIGPGDGMVTNLLLQSGAKVIALEIDTELIPKLEQRFRDFPNFKLINLSILEANIQKVLEDNQAGKNVKVAGSLPYNISKKIIDLFLRFNTLSTNFKISKCCYIVQEEVAKDYVASTPNSSFLSQYSKIFAKVRKLESIPNYMFFPEPKVNGGIIRFDLKEEIPIYHKEFNGFLRSGFSSPRKTLSNNLKSINKYTSDQIQDAFSVLEIKPLARPAELEFEKWEKLFLFLNPQSPNL